MLDTAEIRAALAAVPETPALVFSQAELSDSARRIRAATDDAGVSLLYAMKPCTLSWVMEELAAHVTGFTASSPFEIRLARQVLGDSRKVHYYGVAVAEHEFAEIGRSCDYISFNSIGQLERYGPETPDLTSPGLRLNPGISFVSDERYDPCRRHSKLGAPIERIIAAEHGSHDISAVAQGLLMHTNCESDDLLDLFATASAVDDRLGLLLDRMDWVNLGGGYTFGSATDFAPLNDASALLRSDREIEIFIEPGAAFVADAGFIVSTVLDVFDSGGVDVAVLDTSVNHMPEVFEYQYEPDVLDYAPDGSHRYILAGRSCLAGDVLGDYRFEEPLTPGSRVAILGMGAYTQPKAHTFNGINLPDAYAMLESGELTLLQSTSYGDFAARNGASQVAVS
ncbi:MAG: hypothetical protein FI707_10125 [SAR202 cluster bacterium]|jgi:carboxynorspermidine decarboxylase|nr:hypothetical protein [Chloroflexota bacterium]MDP6422865.1 hypothetical protein [SAR202 cluster bacterium]HAL46979.1 hypothetical protein [Dehalococcoidia bacterium]MDP6665443.1 hypothetical protein [SAR202 cluster bacterium]MDP6798237.1 hypothetical protein [SAR202 cluster bacterium]|tara:strand:- start:1185 stop:2372 length:1188 start_codon:yes stop_codon:yes gene_type:complete